MLLFADSTIQDRVLQYVGVGGATLIVVTFLILNYLKGRKRNGGAHAQAVVPADPPAGLTPTSVWMNRFNKIDADVSNLSDMFKTFLTSRPMTGRK